MEPSNDSYDRTAPVLSASPSITKAIALPGRQSFRSTTSWTTLRKSVVIAVGRRALICALLIDSPSGDQLTYASVPPVVKASWRMFAPVCALHRQPEQSHFITSGQALTQLVSYIPFASLLHFATHDFSCERASHVGSRPEALTSMPNWLLSRYEHVGVWLILMPQPSPLSASELQS